MIIGKKKDTSFIDILSLIKCPEKYHWKIVWIYAFYYPSDLVYLEDKINSSKGYDIKLEDLKRLIESVGQLIELILIGDKGIIEDYSIEKEEEIKNKYDFFIEYVDSSYWEIFSKDNDFSNKLKEFDTNSKE